MNCSTINESVKASGNCSSFSWGVAEPNGSHAVSNCSAELYTGIVCRQQLIVWQDCAVGGESKDVFLDLTLMEQSQEKREKDAAQLLHFFRELSLWGNNVL